MERKKILEAAREESRRGEEFENKVVQNGAIVGFLVSMAVGTALFLLESFVKGTFNTAVYVVILSALGCNKIYGGVKLKHTLQLIIGIVYSVIAVIFAVLYLMREVFI